MICIYVATPDGRIDLPDHLLFPEKSFSCSCFGEKFTGLVGLQTHQDGNLSTFACLANEISMPRDGSGLNNAGVKIQPFCTDDLAVAILYGEQYPGTDQIFLLPCSPGIHPHQRMHHGIAGKIQT